MFATLGSLGDLYPYLALASEMQRRGHQATILTGSQHQSRIDRSGVRFQQVAPDLDFTDKTFQARAMDEVTGGRYMLRDVMLPPIRTNYDNLLQAASEADLLVTQMLAYAGPMVAEKTGIPWVSTILAPLSFFSYRDSPALVPRLRWKFKRRNAANSPDDGVQVFVAQACSDSSRDLPLTDSTAIPNCRYADPSLLPTW